MANRLGKVVEIYLKTAVKDRSVYARTLGHVQLRISSGGEKQVNLSEMAEKVA